VDGLLCFHESKEEGAAKSFLQVKGGGVKRGDVATLLATALFLWA